jgi:hypothetical protein
VKKNISDICALTNFGKVVGITTEKRLMQRIFRVISIIMIIITISSCSKKNHPVTNKPAETKVVKKNTVKTAVPKVIVVNDKYAKRSVDGRYYYDLDGHRYWRNNKDGKYYLFNKSMYDDPAFKGTDL